MRKSTLSLFILGLAVMIAGCDAPGGSSPSTSTTLPSSVSSSIQTDGTSQRVDTVRRFEAALWTGDLETAIGLISEDFSYRHEFETILGKEGLRRSFGGDDHHPPVNAKVESSDFSVQGDVVSWHSVRYFPGSIGQAVALTATFDGDLIAEVTETGAVTRAEDAMGCEGSYGYSWHADYGPEASGVSSDPVESAFAAFPQAIDGVTFAESNLEMEAPMSGGHGPVVRASHDGYTVGFVFFTEAFDGSLLVDAVTACEGILEPAFDEEFEEIEEPPGFESGSEEEFEFSEYEVDASGAAPTSWTPPPDIAGAISGDDGAQTFPLGQVTTLPDSVRLDFLFEFCGGDVCYRDAHFMDPDNPGVGSGPFTADTPFHVRHGFINNDDAPLDDGFDLVIFVTRLDDGEDHGQTYRFTSDYVLRGSSEACGPTYRTQTGAESCEWFVHEFDEGLPEGRHALWALWEAPCWAWVDYGFVDGCDDPDEVMSLFSSGFDSPFGPEPPSYTEANEAPGTTPRVITDTVIVEAGDSLWSIAERHLGVGSDDETIARFWLHVISVNVSSLRSGSPDLIYPGEVIQLPEIGEEPTHG